MIRCTAHRYITCKLMDIYTVLSREREKERENSNEMKIIVHIFRYLRQIWFLEELSLAKLMKFHAIAKCMPMFNEITREDEKKISKVLWIPWQIVTTQCEHDNKSKKLLLNYLALPCRTLFTLSRDRSLNSVAFSAKRPFHVRTQRYTALLSVRFL